MRQSQPVKHDIKVTDENTKWFDIFFIWIDVLPYKKNILGITFEFLVFLNHNDDS